MNGSGFERIKSHEELNFNTIVENALRKTYDLHESLGQSGEETVEKNQFGETALRIDMESEEAVLQALRDSRVPIRVIAEEHGTVDITPNPLYLGVLDGLDGTNRYQAGRGVERYGTMFGVFSSLNPSYDDYLSAGIMEHSTGRLFIANKGEGSFVMANNERLPIHASGREHLDEHTKMYINQYWEVCRKLFSERLGALAFKDPRAYAAYFSDLASGAVDLVVSSTGKNNLELAIGYGLIRESGGVLVDMRGQSLGEEKYLEYGQKDELPVIASSSEHLARELISRVK
jgi:fructose-1,6-bisphosphatase/inositol monophosphatase family enzyme